MTNGAGQRGHGASGMRGGQNPLSPLLPNAELQREVSRSSHERVTATSRALPRSTPPPRPTGWVYTPAPTSPHRLGVHPTPTSPTGWVCTPSPTSPTGWVCTPAPTSPTGWVCTPSPTSPMGWVCTPAPTSPTGWVCTPPRQQQPGSWAAVMAISRERQSGVEQPAGQLTETSNVPERPTKGCALPSSGHRGSLSVALPSHSVACMERDGARRTARTPRTRRPPGLRHNTEHRFFTGVDTSHVPSHGKCTDPASVFSRTGRARTEITGAVNNATATRLAGSTPAAAREVETAWPPEVPCVAVTPRHLLRNL
ncbi:unnamed protein product [Lampetra fluviatilis]